MQEQVDTSLSSEPAKVTLPPPDKASPQYPIAVSLIGEVLGLERVKLKALLRKCNISPKLYRHPKDHSFVSCITKQEAGLFGAILLEDPPKGVSYKVVQKLKALLGAGGQV